jgi:phosphoglycerate dehydrogenase-like enzyme
MPDRPLTVLTHVPVRLLRAVGERFPTVELVQVPERGGLDEGVEGEVLLTQAWGAPNAAQVMQRGIRWVHAYGTGVERYPFDTLGEAALTCSRGASAVPISEWVLAVMLAAEKKLPETWVTHAPEHWNIARLGGLHRKTLALVGFGGIGRAVATRALAFGMVIRALVRKPRPSPVEGVEIVGDLPSLVRDADHVVVAAPSTRETHHLLGAAAFAHMKDGVHLVNVSRGGLVDQDALREALDSGRVGRASLDTVTPEPLPEGHWLYAHPRVRLSPHTSWSGPGAFDELVAPFLRNLRAWLDGAPLEDRVDVELGY